MLAVAALLTYACTEELSPAQQLQQQLVELDASQYISFIAVIEDNGEPLEGATVTLTTVSVDTAGGGGTDSTGGGAGEIISLTATSDADGRAVFAAVQPGGHIMEVAAEGYYSVRAVADFDFIEGYNYTIADGFLVPTAVVESAILPLFPTAAASGANTATIEGKLTIETDVTNLTPEVLANTVVTADLSSLTAIVSDGLAVRGYSINEGQGFGSTTTDANGDYSMVVPASENGTYISLYFPEVETDQVVIANGRGTTVFDEPQAITVNTSFGPNITRDSNIPTNSGIKAIFPNPPTGGEGFTVNNLTKAGRAFPSSDIFEWYTSPFTTSNVSYEFSLGEGYETSPVVNITDPTGEGADIRAYINVGVAGFDMTEPDSGYFSNSNYNLYLYIDYLSGDDTLTSNLRTINISSDNNGVIGQDQVDAAIESAVNNFTTYFANNPRDWNAQIIDMYFEVYNWSTAEFNTLAGTINNEGSVHTYDIFSTGENYTNPTITLTGGGASTAATLSVASFGTRWTFGLNNSGITGTYVISPDILWEYEAITSSANFTDYATTYDVYDPNTGTTGNFDVLTYVNNGSVTFDGEESLQTAFFSFEEPTFFVINENPTPASAVPQLDSDGSLDFLAIVSSGNGYNERFSVIIEPLLSTMGGSGAEITLFGGFQSGDEYQWQGEYLISNAGSGYQVYANQALEYLGNTGQSWTSNGSVNFYISAGETVVRDIDYGTGNRDENIF
ncbi:MAG TPA: hypothetical protein DCR93_02585 [Cytophagales bacterium]|nr:hypothetical protein [Cytophagales bacterium]